MVQGGQTKRMNKEITDLFRILLPRVLVEVGDGNDRDSDDGDNDRERTGAQRSSGEEGREEGGDWSRERLRFRPFLLDRSPVRPQPSRAPREFTSQQPELDWRERRAPEIRARKPHLHGDLEREADIERVMRIMKR